MWEKMLIVSHSGQHVRQPAIPYTNAKSQFKQERAISTWSFKRACLWLWSWNSRAAGRKHFKTWDHKFFFTHLIEQMADHYFSWLDLF